MISILAEVAADPMVSGNWIIGVIGAIAAGIALVIGKKQGRAEAQDNNVTLQGQPISVKMEEHFVTRREFDRLEKVTEGLRRDLAGQYRDLMQAGAAREQNLSDKLDGIARGIHARIDEIIKTKSPR